MPTLKAVVLEHKGGMLFGASPSSGHPYAFDDRESNRGGSPVETVLAALASCSGMDDDVREQITDWDIGRTCEIAYERVGSQGRLQHPRFISWRDDEKLPHDCTIDQDEKLEEYYSGSNNVST